MYGSWQTYHWCSIRSISYTGTGSSTWKDHFSNFYSLNGILIQICSVEKIFDVWVQYWNILAILQLIYLLGVGYEKTSKWECITEYYTISLYFEKVPYMNTYINMPFIPSNLKINNYLNVKAIIIMDYTTLKGIYVYIIVHELTINLQNITRMNLL